MNIAYLQCDMRYNEWLLEKVGELLVVEHTILKIKESGIDRIIAGIYSCDENYNLVKILEQKGVEVIWSDEKDVNVRFLNIVTGENADYVIRVGGDQLLMDSAKVKDIIEGMEELNQEWFYDEYANCILPDVISIPCLRKYKACLMHEKRYFDGLAKQKEIKCHELSYTLLIAFNFRANSNEGFRICKRVIENNLDINIISKRLMKKLCRNNYLVQTGVWGSWLLDEEVQDFFYDERKEVNPWWGRTIIDILRPRLNQRMTVFEWGAGNSTLFWAHSVGDVTSIEHDREWYEKMTQMIPQNVNLKFCELEYGGEYSKAILKENKKFDIVLVDGRDRVRCAMNAVKCLKDDGIIIWDDTEREYYQEGFDFLIEAGFKRLEVKSVSYKAVGYGHPTSMFYRNNNILGL